MFGVNLGWKRASRVDFGQKNGIQCLLWSYKLIVVVYFGQKNNILKSKAAFYVNFMTKVA